MTPFKHPWYHWFFTRWLECRTSFDSYMQWDTLRCDSCKVTFIQEYDNEHNTKRLYIDD